MKLYDCPAVIQELRFDNSKRILVISDIHGNLPYLKGLLQKVGFCDKDELIIDGDFLEKGADSLGTLRYIIELCKAGNVHPICGNCDDWCTVFNAPPEADAHLISYMRSKKCGILWDMFNECGIDVYTIDGFSGYKKMLMERFNDEWSFLASLPHAIETGNYIFAHAAVDPEKPLKEHTVDELVKYDFFMRSRRCFDRWVIVGHTPVVLYRRGTVCANPVVDFDRKIISIDGGCVLKDDGQLNCLIIDPKALRLFSYESYDPFPEYTALDDQEESEKSFYVSWEDSTVQVLEWGEEFSRCRHVSSSYELDILTKYLSGDEYSSCNDCTDYVLPVRKGDRLKVVETTSRGYFCKKDGISGWYYGNLMKPEIKPSPLGVQSPVEIEGKRCPKGG